MFNMSYKSIIEFREKVIVWLDYLLSLPINWGGPDSVPPTSNIVSNIMYFIDNLSIEYILKLDIGEDISPSPTGAIALDFCLGDNDNSHLSLEVGEFNCNFYMKLNDRYIIGQNSLAIREQSTLDIITDNLNVLYK